MQLAPKLLRILAAAVLLMAWAGEGWADFRTESLDNDFKDEIEAAAEENKNLILFVHQDGCPYCDKMRARVHPHPKVMNYFSKHFVMIETNKRGSLEVVTPEGKTTTERDYARKLRVRATPVFVFFDKKGKEALRTTGYMDAERFYLAGRYVTEGVYKKKISFFRYLQNQAK